MNVNWRSINIFLDVQDTILKKILQQLLKQRKQLHVFSFCAKFQVKHLPALSWSSTDEEEYLALSSQQSALHCKHRPNQHTHKNEGISI